MIGASADFAEVDRALARVRAAGLRPAKALTKLRTPVRQDQRTHARNTQGPNGPWPARKVKRRKRLLGRLPGALNVIIKGSILVVESKVKGYSKVQKEGGKVGNNATLPPRDFLWFSPWFFTLARSVLAQYLAASFTFQGT